MTAREPREVAQVAAETVSEGTHRSWDRVLVSASLAGACISATSYWYPFLRDEAEVATPAAEPAERA